MDNSSSKNNNFIGFCKNIELLFIIWVGLGAFSLYLLEFLRNFEYTRQTSAQIILNQTISIQQKKLELLSLDIDSLLFGIATFSAFIIFIIIAFAIFSKSHEFLNDLLIKARKEKGKIFTWDFWLSYFFTIFFAMLNLFIAIYTIKKFFDYLLLFELVTLMSLLILIGVIFVNKRKERKFLDEIVAKINEYRQANKKKSNR